MIKEESIIKLAEEKFSGTDRFLVSVRIHPGNRIVVYIDSDTSVRIEDCAGLSRFIESNINRDVEDYELEVSSAGLTRPLVLKRQYLKNIGREVKSVLKNGTAKKGIISDVTDSGFVMLEKTVIKENKKKQTIENKTTVAFDDIKETKLVINI
jgi:ribosome maturation factor RimP